MYRRQVFQHYIIDLFRHQHTKTLFSSAVDTIKDSSGTYDKAKHSSLLLFILMEETYYTAVVSFTHVVLKFVFQIIQQIVN